MWSRGATRVAVEVKANSRWRREDTTALRYLLAEKVVGRAYGVYPGRERLRDGGVLVLPLEEFVAELAAGALIA